MIRYKLTYNEEMLSGGLTGLKFSHWYSFLTMAEAEQRMKEFNNAGVMTDFMGNHLQYTDMVISLLDTDCPNCMHGNCDHSLLPAPIESVDELGYN